MGFKLGICGAGSFSKAFISLFNSHPFIDEVVLADLLPERLAETAAAFGIKRTLPSHQALCESDVDAIAIFAQRHLHGPLAMQALNAGKHVYCAVPMASELEEIAQIIECVKATGLVYMTGETSYYYPSALYCRKRFESGDFGHFVYGEGNYLHDMSHGFYQAFQHSGGKDWKKAAGFPPMFYPTHSTSLILSVTGARATEVSCFGYVDKEDDAVFGEGRNYWDNPFSNQTALMRTSDGGMMRINEFRRVGWWGASSSNPMTLYGTQGSFEQNCGSQHWTSLDKNEMCDLTEELNCYRHYQGAASEDAGLHEVLQRDFNSQFAKVHPYQRLPKTFVGQRNGHLGSHQFLVDDFARAVEWNQLPPNNAWAAARYCAPGLVAHKSCLSGGSLMPIPDFGTPPATWTKLDVDSQYE